MAEVKYEHSTNYNAIRDPAVKRILREFFEKGLPMYRAAMKKTAVSNDKTFFNNAVVILSRIYKDATLPFDTELFLSTLGDAWQITGTFQIFWLFLCEKGYAESGPVRRLTDFKDVILNRKMSADNLRTILHDTKYDECFRTSRYYGRLHESSVLFSDYFFEPDLSGIADIALREYMGNYFQELKYSDYYADGSLRYAQVAVNSVVQDLLSNKAVEDITRQDVLPLVKKYAGVLAKSNDHIRAVYTLIYDLNNAGFKVNIPLARAASLLARKGVVSLSDWENLMLTEDVDKWYLLKDTRKGYEGQYRRLLYIDYPYREVRDVVALAFEETGLNGSELKVLGAEFKLSLGNHCPATINDFGFKDFKQQLYYLRDNNYTGRFYQRLIVRFYRYIYDNLNENLFKSDYITPAILARQNIGNEIIEGYEVINYTPAEAPPASDKWILCYGDVLRSNSMIGNGTFSYQVDFTDIACKEYRQHVKQWFWYYDCELTGKISDLRVASSALNYIYDIKMGRALNIYSRASGDLKITMGDIIAWKTWMMNNHKNNRTRNHQIYSLRKYFTYACESGIYEYDPGIFYHLTHTLKSDYNNSRAIPNDELSKIASVMKAEAEKGITEKLCCSAFFLALETEMRQSQLFALSKNCVRETAKKDEYVVVTRDKTSSGAFVECPITIYVKREIDEVIAATEDIRLACSNIELKDYLFVVPSLQKGYVKILNAQRFNDHLKKCCRIAGTPEYTISNLRDTHMTKADEEIIRKSLSDIQMRVLTGHKTPNSDSPYISENIRNMLEAVHGIIIGDISVEGKVVNESSKNYNEEDAVSQGCGYCKNSHCDDSSYLDCLLCKHFVTMPDKLDFFYERVKEIDYKLPLATTPHDREDLVNIKRLLLYFIEKMLEVKEAEEDATGTA